MGIKWDAEELRGYAEGDFKLWRVAAEVSTEVEILVVARTEQDAREVGQEVALEAAEDGEYDVSIRLTEEQYADVALPVGWGVKDLPWADPDFSDELTVEEWREVLEVRQEVRGLPTSTDKKTRSLLDLLEAGELGDDEDDEDDGGPVRFREEGGLSAPSRDHEGDV